MTASIKLPTAYGEITARRGFGGELELIIPSLAGGPTYDRILSPTNVRKLVDFIGPIAAPAPAPSAVEAFKALPIGGKFYPVGPIVARLNGPRVKVSETHYVQTMDHGVLKIHEAASILKDYDGIEAVE